MLAGHRHPPVPMDAVIAKELGSSAPTGCRRTPTPRCCGWSRASARAAAPRRQAHPARGHGGGAGRHGPVPRSRRSSTGSSERRHRGTSRPQRRVRAARASSGFERLPPSLAERSHDAPFAALPDLWSCDGPRTCCRSLPRNVGEDVKLDPSLAPRSGERAGGRSCRRCHDRTAWTHTRSSGFHGIRYQVTDVARSVAFYTQHLGFKLEHQRLPAFANVSLGDAQLLLSGPGASGSRPMPTGQRQEPGGWNRVVLRVSDLPAFVATPRAPDCAFATSWKPVPADVNQIEDPDGNPIELFEPAR